MFKVLNFFRRRSASATLVPPRQLRFTERQERRGRRRRVLRLVLVMMALIGIATLVVFFFSRFSVRHLLCRLDGETCEKELSQKAEALVGKSMFSNLRLTHPYLSVSIKRVWPDGLEVQFASLPLLLVFRPSTPESTPYGLTQSGYIVAGRQVEPPVPIGDLELEKRQKGERVGDSTLKFYQDLVTAIAKVSLPIVQILVVSPDEVEIQLDKRTLVLLSEKDITADLSSLQSILQSPTIEREGKTIDLRFSNPVIK